jgi:hypothetical protein
MTTTTYDGAFQETFLLGVTRKGTGQELQFAGVTEYDSLDIKQGDKDGESLIMLNGGRRWKRTPEGEFEFTCKIYPLSTVFSDAEDLSMYFLGGFNCWTGTVDTTAPVSNINTRGRDLFGVAILWTDDSTAVAASGTTTAYTNSRRILVRDCRITGYKDGFDDGILSAEVTFKAPAFDSTGQGNIFRQSTKLTDSAGLAATAYT